MTDKKFETLDGINSQGDVTIAGNVAVNTDTLYVDSQNSRVGIGKSNPSTELDVDGTAVATLFSGAFSGDGSSLTGVNATTVDGINGASLLRSDAEDTLQVNGNTTILSTNVVISTGSNLITHTGRSARFGTTSTPSATFSFANTASQAGNFDLTTAGSINFRIGQGAGTTMTVNGAITATSFSGDGSSLTDLPVNQCGTVLFGGGIGPSSAGCCGCHNNFFGLAAGYKSFSFSRGNNFFGNNAGICNTSGNDNNFFGQGAGARNCSGSCNNFIGYFSGFCSCNGNHNNFLGSSAGRCNTSGSYNNFFGKDAGRNNSSGYDNNFFGLCAGRSNCTGSFNNFIGSLAGCSNITGRYNNFFGRNAGCRNTGGCSNNFLGSGAGRCNTTGSQNNFFGCRAGGFNTIGGNNNFFGFCAGLLNDSGSYNNFLGRFAGYSNTSGGNNNFFGSRAGQNNTYGSNNNFFGDRAGRSNTTGCHNNFFGLTAGYSNTTGCHNNFFGWQAGINNTTGCNNIAIGCRSGLGTFGLFNLTCHCNRIIMGNCDHTCAQIAVAWTTVSDVRDKCIYGSIQRGLGFLEGITPIEYQFKDRENDEITDPLHKRRYGFSAQEILELEGNHPVIVSAEDPEKLQLTTDHLIPVMVNAIKELSAEVNSLKERIAILEQ